jgi:hypothetical protein
MPSSARAPAARNARVEVDVARDGEADRVQQLRANDVMVVGEHDRGPRERVSSRFGRHNRHHRRPDRRGSRPSSRRHAPAASRLRSAAAHRVCGPRSWPAALPSRTKSWTGMSSSALLDGERLIATRSRSWERARRNALAASVAIAGAPVPCTARLADARSEGHAQPRGPGDRQGQARRSVQRLRAYLDDHIPAATGESRHAQDARPRRVGHGEQTLAFPDGDADPCTRARRGSVRMPGPLRRCRFSSL